MPSSRIDRERPGFDPGSGSDLWRAAIDALPDGACILGASGQIVAVNRRLCEMTGFAPADLVGCDPPFPYWSVEEAKIIADAYRGFLEGEQAANFEFVFRRRGGEIFPVQVYASTFDPGAPGGRHWVTTIRDISERKFQDAELRRSEQRWRSIAENPFDFVTVIGPDYKYTYVNHAAPPIQLHDLVGKATPFDYVEPAHHEVMRKAFDRAFREGVAGSYESYTPQLDKWFGSVVGPIFEGGVVTSLSILTRDVSETKRAAEAVRNSEHRLRLALAGGDVGAFDLNVSTGELYCSPHFYALLGYPLDDPRLFRTIEEFQLRIHPDESAIAAAALRDAMESQAPFDVEYRLRTADGSYRWFHGRGRSLREADGVVHFSGFVTDITERKMANEERRKLEAQLRHAQKLETLGTLAGGIAHDFNNLLVPILGNAQLALRAVGPSSPVQGELDDILRAAMRARELVGRILVFGRRAEERREAVGIAALIREVMGFLNASVPSNVKIAANVVDDCPAVVGDANQIHQALTNVCTNAYQALGQRGGRIDITVDTVQVDSTFGARYSLEPGPFVRISVCDSGPGMPREVLERIFEPFFTTKAPGEGTGLGLAMVHAILTKHGGTAMADSELGQGARVQLYFPAGPRAGAESAAGPARLSANVVIPLRILCVDDEPGVLRALARILTQAGHQVTAQTSPAEALELVRRSPAAFDVVVTDLTMPGMRGTELASQLALLRPDLPVVLATGYGDVTLGAGTLAPNIRVCLEKPIDVDALIEGIRRAAG